MSEDDIKSMDSNDSQFLFKVIPPIEKQYPACFCEQGNHCPKHQGKDPQTVDIIKLLEKQFKEVENDENEQENEIMNMDEEIKEIFVSRQDTFKEKVANAYIKKTEECKELREEIERL